MVGLFPNVPLGGLVFNVLFKLFIFSYFFTELANARNPAMRRKRRFAKELQKLKKLGDIHVAYYPRCGDFNAKVEGRDRRTGKISAHMSLNLTKLYVFKMTFNHDTIIGKFLNNTVGYFINYRPISKELFNGVAPHVSLAYGKSFKNYAAFHDYCVEPEIQLQVAELSGNPRWGLLRLSADENVLILAPTCEVYGFCQRLQRLMPGGLNEAYDRLHLSLG